MGGFDEHVAIMGDWMPPSPSPRAFFSSILGDDFGTTRENKSGTLISELEGYDLSRNSDGKGDQAASMSSRGGGLLERMAARAGFNAPRLNTESIRPADLSQNQEVRSPYLTIPPGLSPTTLLDSPVFLSNSLAQPSPTTGKFPFPSSGDVHISPMFMEASHQSKESSFDNNDSSSFAFKPVIQTAPSLFPSTFGKVPQFSLARQSFPSAQISVQSEPTQVYEQNGTLQQPDFSRSSTEMNNGSGNITSSIEHSPPPDEVQDEETDQRGCVDPNFLGAPADDGYNWRKYGQKQVKGSEYPRSYYKCTHTNCPVKKKVERSQEGHITEIIYKGAHNHPKPPPNRRSGLGPTNPLGDMQIENTEQGGNGGDGNPIWANMQKGDPDWRNNNLEVTTSTPLGSEYCNGAQNVTQFESRDAVDRSSTFSNDEDEDDRVTHGSASLGYDGEGDESESKRRKIETYAADMSGATRAIREPRVVVQTTSEVDILDDGYRWRKYGQKVVKGNPNPRSYYKCTSAGCTVRKHVERASHDLKSVITTYEGKHNHDVPAARNSSHFNSGGGSNSGPTQGAPPPTQPHLHRPEPSQLQNAMARFDGPFSFGLAGRPQPGFGFGMNLQGLTNLAMAGKMPALPVHHPYIGQHRPSVNNMSFMGEPKMEPASDPGLNISNGSSVYQQVMSRLPLGPHM